MIIVPRSYRKKLAKKNAYRREVPKLGSGQKLATMKDIAELWDKPKQKGQAQTFKEALALCERYEGHQKMVSQLMQRQTKDDNFDEKVIKHEEQLAQKIVIENEKISKVNEEKYITEQIEIIKEEEKRNAKDNKS